MGSMKISDVPEEGHLKSDGDVIYSAKNELGFEDSDGKYQQFATSENVTNGDLTKYVEYKDGETLKKVIGGAAPREAAQTGSAEPFDNSASVDS